MDRVYSADQSSNTVTVIDPSANGGLGQVLGTLPLGNPRLDGLLTPLYFREVKVHGLGFSPDGSMLDAINTTTDSATVIDTATNTVRSTAHIGRAPHEGFITPDGGSLWTAVRGQDYISVTDVQSGQETDRIQTMLGPSKVVFSPDGSLAFVNSSRTPELDVISVATQQVIQRVTNLVSPFSPDLAISPDGSKVWLTHKDVGKVTVVDANTFQVLTVLNTGPITNHVNFVTYGVPGAGQGTPGDPSP